MSLGMEPSLGGNGVLIKFFVELCCPFNPYFIYKSGPFIQGYASFIFEDNPEIDSLIAASTGTYIIFFY
jgi:hypothetical protein